MPLYDLRPLKCVVSFHQANAHILNHNIVFYCILTLMEEHVLDTNAGKQLS
jgi:hypothetical protein